MFLLWHTLYFNKQTTLRPISVSNTQPLINSKLTNTGLSAKQQSSQYLLYRKTSMWPSISSLGRTSGPISGQQYSTAGIIGAPSRVTSLGPPRSDWAAAAAASASFSLRFPASISVRMRARTTTALSASKNTDMEVSKKSSALFSLQCYLLTRRWTWRSLRSLVYFKHSPVFSAGKSTDTEVSKRSCVSLTLTPVLSANKNTDISKKSGVSKHAL